MERGRNQILIVEDDATLGAALRETFARAGFQVTLAKSGVLAVQAAENVEFHGLVVDCMLPKLSGVDCVEQINAAAIKRPFVILTSGVFRDKAFQTEAIERTGAAAFLTKPFPPAEALALVESHFATEVTVQPRGLVSLYAARPLDAKALAELCAREPIIPGLHLPMLFRRLQLAGSSGELVMITSTGDLNSVCLSGGRISAVRTTDRETAFGALAVGLGFVAPEDLESALNDPEPKLIGQKLVERMALSPHAAQLVIEEQLALRLSLTVEEGALSIHWSDREMPAPEFCLSLERFHELTDDWTRSKIEAAWIRDYFLPWSEYRLIGPAVESLKATTIGDLLSHPQLNDEVDLPRLLRQLINGNVTLGSRKPSADYRFLETRLARLAQTHPQQNYFEVLGVTENASSAEIKRAFEQLRGAFDPANLGDDCPPRVMIKATQIFRRISDAHAVLTDDRKRARYSEEQMNQRAQVQLEAEPTFRRAIQLLSSGRSTEAAEIFDDLLARRIELEDLRAYRNWARLATDRTLPEADLAKVAPEHRFSAPYHAARGLLYRNRGDLAKAVTSFSAALVLDPSLKVIRAELDRARQTLDSRTSRTLLGELSTQLGRRFGRGA